MNIEYYVVNPCGNITALVLTAVPTEKYGIVAKQIMKNEPSVEQVGFVKFSNDYAYLRMAGDEFCGNATICTAALFCEMANKSGRVNVEVFGCNNVFAVDVKKYEDAFFCEGYFEKSNSAKKAKFTYNGKSFNGTIVELKGISHIITTDLIEENCAKEFIKDYSIKNDIKALGIMMLGEENKLTPIVYVKNIDTLFFENSCGSGSCAVAEALLKNIDESMKLIQPGGDITVQNKGNCIKLSEKVIIERKVIKGGFFEF